MPRAKNIQADPVPAFHPLVINFGDEATQWFRDLSEAVQANPSEIRVQFVGGCTAPPFEIISLRNALLEIPRHIRLVTAAVATLPPFACAAWLVGDERRIARDALVWIPNLPEEILRNGLRHPPTAPEAAEATHDSVEEEEEDSDEEAPPFHTTLPRHKEARSMRRSRLETDLRALADVINEWFPTWEFSGGYLCFSDLVEWQVIKPEWGFGGRSVRTRESAFAANTEDSAPNKTKRHHRKKESPGEPRRAVPTKSVDGSSRVKTSTKPPEAA